MAAPPGSLRSSKRALLSAGGIGNFVEWYDFTIYGFSIAIVAAAYFPEGNPTAALLAAFAVYGVAFVARPLGAMFFGSLGDRIGRRNTLALAILLMAAATATVGFLPTYQSIGLFAPILLVLARLAQGFSAGGEFSGVATFVYEHAPENRRATWVAGVSMFALLGMGSAAVTVLIFAMGFPEAYVAWGWRVPFILGGLVALVGLYFRLRLDETPVFKALESANQVKKSPLRDAAKAHWRELGILFCVFSYQGVAGHSIVGYLPTYLSQEVGMEATTALLIAGFAMLAGAAIGLAAARLSETVGRRPVVISALLTAVALTIPAYLMIGVGAGMTSGIIAELLLVTPFAAVVGVMMPTMMELISPAVRFSAAAVGYNVPYMVFGGTAPFMAALLVAWTGSGVGAGVYISIIAAVALLVVISWLPETRPESARVVEARLAANPVADELTP